tara:strand:+ start:214 stop:612 length:399 start_codon:yes stop_codon:yes gene_type:complete
MALIGRQPSSSTFLKLDDISSQFNNSTSTFNLTIGGEAFFAGNPYSLLVSLGGVIQEPIKSFTIVENQINFASAPNSGANFFCVVLATTNVTPLRTLTIGTRSTAQSIDLHGRQMSVKGRDGSITPIAFNLA